MNGETATDLEPLLTLKQAADSWGISVRQLYRIIACGEIPVIRIGQRSPRIRPSDLRRFLESHTEDRSKENL